MWGRRRRTDEDFAQEVDSHLRLETEKLTEDGMRPMTHVRRPSVDSAM